MNYTTQVCAQLNGKAFIKIHCSSGQVCKHYVDPDTGKPLNFNYLPIYADERLGKREPACCASRNTLLSMLPLRRGHAAYGAVLLLR